MARKVFISILGTGLYERCKYISDGFKSSDTLFVQQATMEHLSCQSWTSHDRAFILLTNKARSDNWELEKDMRYDFRKETDVPYKGLKKTLDELKFPCSVEGISIPDGKDEKEMWEIFETAFNLLDDSDDVYFDLTHSFRYLPMLILVLGNYAKFLKKIKVKSITYGNYEARDRSSNEAPIVNLLPLSSLQDWTFAIADYIENGYTKKLADLSIEKVSAAYRKKITPQKQDEVLTNFVKKLDNMLSERLTCRGMGVTASIKLKEVQKSIYSLQEIVTPHYAHLFSKVQESINSFNTDYDIHNLFSAAKWCIDKRLYQQSITFIREGTISKICDSLSIHDLDDRELVPKAFRIKGEELKNKKPVPEKSWSVFADKDRAIIKKILRSPYCQKRELVNAVNSMIDLRNDFNHCGMKKQPNDPNSIIKNINKYITVIEPNLFDNTFLTTDQPKVFINLSNHPSSVWEDNQKNAATFYGKITDIDFPVISPQTSQTEIRDMAAEFAKNFCKMAKDATITVHIMGEMTFTYALVSRLKAEGITCVASTTERIVTEKDGIKSSEFKFVKFREY